jgi:glutamate-1-semialdehyde 2,1-aminomutase
LPLCFNRVGSMFTLFFAAGPVNNLAGAQTSDTGIFQRFFQEMLARGVYLPPSQFEAWFLSLAHSPQDLGKTMAALDKVFTLIRR